MHSDAYIRANIHINKIKIKKKEESASFVNILWFPKMWEAVLPPLLGVGGRGRSVCWQTVAVFCKVSHHPFF